MKQIIAALALLATVGCATQPSTYTDLSTPDQRNIQATGQAATEAARSNRSTNADVEVRGNGNISLPMSTQQANDPRYDRQLYNADGTRNRAAERAYFMQNANSRSRQGNTYGDYTAQRARSQFDWRMKRKIDKEIERFMEKLF